MKKYPCSKSNPRNPTRTHLAYVDKFESDKQAYNFIVYIDENDHWEYRICKGGIYQRWYK